MICALPVSKVVAASSVPPTRDPPREGPADANASTTMLSGVKTKACQALLNDPAGKV